MSKSGLRVKPDLKNLQKRLNAWALCVDAAQPEWKCGWTTGEQRNWADTYYSPLEYIAGLEWNKINQLT